MKVREAFEAAGEVESGSVAVEVWVRPLWKAPHPRRRRQYPIAPLSSRGYSARVRLSSEVAQRRHPVSPAYSREPLLPCQGRGHLHSLPSSHHPPAWDVSLLQASRRERRTGTLPGTAHPAPPSVIGRSGGGLGLGELAKSLPAFAVEDSDPPHQNILSTRFCSSSCWS